jgi:hypothetical protein
MTPDDEILFGHVADESRSSFERVTALAGRAHAGSLPPDLALAVAQFELHGATLRSLLRWYPDEARIRKALMDWELFSVQLATNGLPITLSP